MWVMVKAVDSFDCTNYYNVSNLAYDSETNTYTVTYINAGGTEITATVNGATNYVMVLMNGVE